MSHSRPGKWCRVSKNLQLKGKEILPGSDRISSWKQIWEIESNNDILFLSVLYYVNICPRDQFQIYI